MTSIITNSIRFWGDEPPVELLRLTRDGIWANPDVPADETAKLVLAALDINIKVLVQKAVEAEREACAKVADDLRSCSTPLRGLERQRWQDRASPFTDYVADVSAAIRRRGEL
jgi:hypothetical protein